MRLNVDTFTAVSAVKLEGRKRGRRLEYDAQFDWIDLGAIDMTPERLAGCIRIVYEVPQPHLSANDRLEPISHSGTVEFHREIAKGVISHVPA